MIKADRPGATASSRFGTVGRNSINTGTGKYFRFFVSDIAAEHIVIAGESHELRQSVIRQTPFFTLLHLDRAAPEGTPRVLVVEPLSGIRAPLLCDMLSNLAVACDVFVLIWADPASIPPAAGVFGLDDNIDSVIYALQVLGENTHVIGLCQSALPVLAAASVLSASGANYLPASIALLGGKLDTNIQPTRIDLLARSFSLDWFMRYLITPVPGFRAGAGRLVYSAEMQAVTLLTYITRHMMTRGEIFLKTMYDDGDDPILRPFFGLLSPVAIPAEFFLDTMSATFHDSLLAKGRLRWRGLPVEPEAIRKIALLTLEAEFDDLAGPGQTKIAHSLCASLPAASRMHVTEPGIGHFGLFHGGVWRRRILPRLLGFFQQAETGMPAVSRVDAGQGQNPELPADLQPQLTERSLT